jgi:hypothetical protein
VHEPGEEVGGQVGQDGQYRHQPQVAEVDHPPVDLYAYQHETENAEYFQSIVSSARLWGRPILCNLVFLDTYNLLRGDYGKELSLEHSARDSSPEDNAQSDPS